MLSSVVVRETEEDSMLPTTIMTPKISVSFSVYRIDSYTVMIFDSYQKLCSWRLWLEVICQDNELHNPNHVYTSVGPTWRRDDFPRCPECLLEMKLSCQRKMWPTTIPECILVVILITPSLSLPHITMNNIFLLSGVLNRNGSRVLELWLNHPYMHSIGGLCSWKWSLESDS